MLKYIIVKNQLHTEKIKHFTLINFSFFSMLKTCKMAHVINKNISCFY